MITVAAVSDIACVAVGIVVLWARWGRSGLQAVGIHEMLEKFGVTGGRAYVIELIGAVIIGTFVIELIVKPHGPANCFTTGCTWTGLVSTPAKSELAPRG